jgi:hypothetical protein
MKKSTQLQFVAIIILVAVAAVDAISIYLPLAALGGIALLLFKPKWLLSFFQKIYEKPSP